MQRALYPVLGPRLLGLATIPMTHAALESRLGSRAVSDPDLGIGWLPDASARAGSSHNGDSNVLDRQMRWSSGLAWAASLNVLGWRLASTPKLNS